MYLSLSDEQRFLVDAARDALGRHDTLGAARAALDGAPAPSLWGLAAEAGWSGLLIGEDADGVGLSPAEAVLVLEACGRRLADARLLGHLPATALLAAASWDVGELSALATGEHRAALVDATVGDRSMVLDVAELGPALVVRGRVRGALDAAEAQVLVVCAVDRHGAPIAGAVSGDAPGLVIEPRAGYDATRALATVAMDDVELHPLDLRADRVRDGADLQRLLVAAESVGAADGCLQMARTYAVERKAFGRAIGSYQAIKHKLVEMLRRIEGARSLLMAAGRAWDADRDRFMLLANAARVAAADALDYSAPENIFIHGGVGATWEHDASLYYRRAELARRLAGGPDLAAVAVADALFAEMGATQSDTPAPVAAAAGGGRAPGV